MPFSGFRVFPTCPIPTDRGNPTGCPLASFGSAPGYDPGSTPTLRLRGTFDCPGSCNAAALRSGQGIPLGSHPQRASAGRAGDSRCADDALMAADGLRHSPQGAGGESSLERRGKPRTRWRCGHRTTPPRAPHERHRRAEGQAPTHRRCTQGVRRRRQGPRAPRGARSLRPGAIDGSGVAPVSASGRRAEPGSTRPKACPALPRGPKARDKGGVQANLQGPDAPLRHRQPPNGIPGRSRGPRARPTPREERKGHTDAVRCAGSEESHCTVAVPSESGIRRPAPRPVRAEARDPAGSEVARRGRWEPEGPHPPSERCPPRPDHDQRPITCPEADAPSLVRSGPRAADCRGIGADGDRLERTGRGRVHGGVRRGGPQTDEAQPSRGSVKARPSCEVTPRRGAGGRSRSRFEGAASGLDRGRGRGDRRRDGRPKPKVHGATAVADAEGRCAGPKTRPDCSGRARPQARAASRPATMRAFA